MKNCYFSIIESALISIIDSKATARIMDRYFINPTKEIFVL